MALKMLRRSSSLVLDNINRPSESAPRRNLEIRPKRSHNALIQSYCVAPSSHAGTTTTAVDVMTEEKKQVKRDCKSAGAFCIVNKK